MTMRPSDFRFTVSAKKMSASPEIEVAGYSLMRSRAGCAAAGMTREKDSATAAAKGLAFIGFPQWTGRSCVRPAQRAIEIGVKIVDIFQADREPQQVGRAGRVRRSEERRVGTG